MIQSFILPNKLPPEAARRCHRRVPQHMKGRARAGAQMVHTGCTPGDSPVPGIRKRKGARPEQAVLSRDTNLSKTDETRAVIEGMVDGLNDHRIDDIGQFFAQSFPLDGQHGLRHQDGPARVPGQLATPVSGGLFRQGLRR